MVCAPGVWAQPPAAEPTSSKTIELVVGESTRLPLGGERFLVGNPSLLDVQQVDARTLLLDPKAAGRTFLWYTTEFDELEHCDRICVFRSGAVVDEFPRSALSEERVIQSSFRKAG